MAIAVDISTRASVDEVAEAIRQDLREWRESKIPRELAADGVLQVVGTVKASSFRMTYSGRWRWDALLELRGTLNPLPNGGTRIIARCGRLARLPEMMGVLAILILWTWFSGNSGAGVLIVFGTIGFTIQLLADMAVSRGNAGARFLVERLEGAVALAHQLQ